MIDGSKVATSRNKLPIQHQKATESPVEDLFQVAKKIMIKGKTLYRVDSGFVEPKARKWNGQSDENGKVAIELDPRMPFI